MQTQKVILLIMDGWGLAEDPSASAIQAAHTPFFDYALRHYPFMKLQASSQAVGLPAGQMGNSEVGHMNIGAGRIIYQFLERINQELDNHSLESNAELQRLIQYCQDNQKPVHLLGLLSDGGVHSSIHHLQGLVRILAKAGLSEIYIHAFMDGRDTSPTGGQQYLADLQQTLDEVGTGKIASLIGRYYAMDRDKRWDRIKKAYDLLVHGTGQAFDDPQAAIAQAYGQEITDEFVEPCVITENGSPVGTIAQGDAVLFYNFRTDRGRQLTTALSQQDFPDQEMGKLDLHYATMTRYDDTFEGVHVLLEKETISQDLGEYLAQQGKTQVRIAETEKYAHVTYFFNNGREKPMEGEQHLLVESPKVATYDLQPEMSAGEIRDRIIEQIQQHAPDFICLNFANPDMVGHTGVFEAAVKACETVDSCTEAVVKAASEAGYIALVTADHGNADKLRNPDGSPHTAHTTALVPLFLIDPQEQFMLDPEAIGKLGDLAPTILRLMGLEIPSAMTGDVLAQVRS